MATAPRVPLHQRVAVTPTAPATRTARPGRARSARRSLSIPSLAVRAPLVPVSAPSSTLTPPADSRTLGWWAEGAAPGSRRGSSLIAGHTVHTGGGALDRLEDVHAGDAVVVRTAGRALRYEVRSVRVLSKAALSASATRLFRQDGPGRLVLVTCEDWDGVGYRSNVVVIAVPARSPASR